MSFYYYLCRCSFLLCTIGTNNNARALSYLCTYYSLLLVNYHCITDTNKMGRADSFPQNAIESNIYFYTSKNTITNKAAITVITINQASISIDKYSLLLATKQYEAGRTNTSRRPVHHNTSKTSKYKTINQITTLAKNKSVNISTNLKF